MKLTKEFKITSADGTTEYRYVDERGIPVGIPVEYWGPLEIEVPDAVIKHENTPNG